MPTLLLTTTGRTQRRAAHHRRSSSAADGDDYLVVASMGGAPTHPHVVPATCWPNPHAEIQVKAEHITVTAPDRVGGREAAALGRS